MRAGGEAAQTEACASTGVPRPLPSPLLPPLSPPLLLAPTLSVGVMSPPSGMATATATLTAPLYRIPSGSYRAFTTGT